jgi:hypothetical protein
MVAVLDTADPRKTGPRTHEEAPRRGFLPRILLLFSSFGIYAPHIRLLYAYGKVNQNRQSGKVPERSHPAPCLLSLFTTPAAYVGRAGASGEKTKPGYLTNMAIKAGY